MSENDYVATAAAEKRLREVLADRLPLNVNSDEIADALLGGAEIDYKPRTKRVTISLTLPEKATATASKAIVEPEEGVEKAPEGTPIGDFGPDHLGANSTCPDFPVPHIAAFAPVLDPDREYEDIHFD